MELIFLEENFLIKTLSAPEELEAGFRLRHEVFSEELKWVPTTPEGTEIDRYDSFSEYIGVFDFNRTLLAHARLTVAPNPFMVEKEFACMMPPGKKVPKTPDTSEITRLCVKKDERSNISFAHLSQLLYKGIYQWSLGRSMRHMIMVVDKRYFRLLRLNGFPVEALNDFTTMPDGVMATVISLDWRRFESIAAEKKPEFLAWMSTLPVPYPSLSLSHGSYLQH